MRVRKWMAALLALFFALPACAVTPEDYDKNLPQMLEEDHLYAESAVLMDAISGETDGGILTMSKEDLLNLLQ